MELQHPGQVAGAYQIHEMKTAHGQIDCCSGTILCTFVEPGSSDPKVYSMMQSGVAHSDRLPRVLVLCNDCSA